MHFSRLSAPDHPLPEIAIFTLNPTLTSNPLNELFARSRIKQINDQNKTNFAREVSIKTYITIKKCILFVPYFSAKPCLFVPLQEKSINMGKSKDCIENKMEARSGIEPL